MHKINSRRTWSTSIGLLLFIIALAPAQAAGFRCGTKLVVTGDPISRLIRACGQPGLKYKAKEPLKRGGGAISVTQWVYERGRNKDMIVSVRDGKVVKIRTER